MGLNKTYWVPFSASSIAGNTESALASCALINLSSTVQFSISIACGYGPNTSTPALVSIYASPDGSIFDFGVSPYASFENNVTTNSTRMTTVPISPDPCFVKLTVKNQYLNTGNISNVTVWVTQAEIS